MKIFPLFCFVFLSAFFATAQNNIQLQLAPRLGNAVFAMNTPVSAGGYEYKFTRLEFYVAEIKITHDGGQITPVTDKYLLVRPAVDSVYDLGSFPEITTVEAITFSVGVDQPHNHLDPALYAANHPLAPQNPAMHWGWSAGYRFAAIEGIAGVNFANQFEIHALGDANYKTQTINCSAETLPDGNKAIHLLADYARVLQNINVSGGIIVHGTSGAAVTLLNNMKNLVFTAQSVSATIDPEFGGTFQIMPNPGAAGQTTAALSLPTGAEYRITMTDLTGRLVLNTPVDSGSQSFQFREILNSGVYFVHLWQNNRPVAVEKLVITQ